MDPFSIIFAVISLAEKLIERASQTGELTEAQKTVLQAKAENLFAKYSTAPPPPAGA